MQISPAKVAELQGPAPVSPEPSLGDVSFDEWFDTPVFESDTDERLEELATARRGPLRLAASTLLRVNARTERARTRRIVDGPGLRSRVSSAIDRWAESEVRAQERLERLLLPKKWQLR